MSTNLHAGPHLIAVQLDVHKGFRGIASTKTTAVWFAQVLVATATTGRSPTANIAVCAKPIVQAPGVISKAIEGNGFPYKIYGLHPLLSKGSGIMGFTRKGVEQASPIRQGRNCPGY